MPTTQGESTGEVRTRSEVLAEYYDKVEEKVVPPRVSLFDTLLVMYVAFALVLAGASAPETWLLTGTAAGLLVLLAVRRIAR